MAYFSGQPVQVLSSSSSSAAAAPSSLLLVQYLFLSTCRFASWATVVSWSFGRCALKTRQCSSVGPPTSLVNSPSDSDCVFSVYVCNILSLLAVGWLPISRPPWSEAFSRPSAPSVFSFFNPLSELILLAPMCPFACNSLLKHLVTVSSCFRPAISLQFLCLLVFNSFDTVALQELCDCYDL